MNRVIHLRSEAENGIFEAASWYENQREGLGHEFLDVVEATFLRIAEHPSQYPVLHRNTRRALLPRFPFGIFFRVDGANIVVLAIFHASRNPARWRERT